MKKFFVSALTVLNFLCASAQEERTNISSTPVDGAAEVATAAVSNNQSAAQEPVQTAQQSAQVAQQAAQAAQQSAQAAQQSAQAAQESAQSAQQSAQSAQQSVQSIQATKPATQPSAQTSSSSASTSSSSSDDYDSDYFASNNEAESTEGDIRNVLGIRAGYCISRVSSYGVYSAAVSGFTVGAMDQIWFGERNVFSEVGLFFVQKGYSLKDFEPSETKINYIELPVLLCHRIGRESLSIAAKAGGFLSVGVSGKLKTFVSENPTVIDLFKSENEFDVFKEGAIGRFDAGVRFGMDIVIKKVLLGCRYDLGLYKIDKKDIIYGDDNLMLGYKNLNNRSFQLLIGINFN